MDNKVPSRQTRSLRAGSNWGAVFTPYFATHPMGVGADDEHKHVLARRAVGVDLLNVIFLRFTAGEPLAFSTSTFSTSIASFCKSSDFAFCCIDVT